MIIGTNTQAHDNDHSFNSVVNNKGSITSNVWRTYMDAVGKINDCFGHWRSYLDDTSFMNTKKVDVPLDWFESVMKPQSYQLAQKTINANIRIEHNYCHNGCSRDVQLLHLCTIYVCRDIAYGFVHVCACALSLMWKGDSALLHCIETSSLWYIESSKWYWYSIQSFIYNE